MATGGQSLTSARGQWLSGLCLVLITVVAYIPALNGGFIWDDDRYVIRNSLLRDVHGLEKIWLHPFALPQYYPLVHTTFWVEYQLWGLRPFGYHLLNVLLHGVNAVLLWRLLKRLGVVNGWLAAAVFALHPVHVESVAWITERKNVLSGLFYLSSILAYLRFRPLAEVSITARPWRFYWLALGLYGCALLSKTVTCTMPAAVLLLIWWKHGRIARRDVVNLLPFFVTGFLYGLATAWLEVHHLSARGPEWAYSFVERCLIAGRALWFYAGKLIWPTNLVFSYPQWAINAREWWQYLLPLAACAVIAALWVGRARIGKAPVVALLFFIGTLLPALGFVNVYPMRYTFVADHFQYLASIGLITLGVVVASKAMRRVGLSHRGANGMIALALLLSLGSLSWRQARIYKNLDTLWRDTLAKNPSSWMAHNNLATILMNQGQVDEVIIHLQQAIQVKPDDPPARNNLGIALMKKDRMSEAIAQFREALRQRPNYAEAHNNLGTSLTRQGKDSEAIAHFQEAARILPDDALAYENIGAFYLSSQRYDEAAEYLKKALARARKQQRLDLIPKIEAQLEACKRRRTS